MCVTACLDGHADVLSLSSGLVSLCITPAPAAAASQLSTFPSRADIPPYLGLCPTRLSLLPSSVQVLGTSSVQLSQLSEVLAPHLSPMQPLQITHTIK